MSQAQQGDASAPASTAVAPQPAAQRLPVIESETLLRGQRAIEISHKGVVYRLQATRLGKLILTK